VNKITATGRIVADAEVRFLPAGDAIANFRLASDVGFGDKKTTNWFQCSIFGKRGDALAPHLLKGLPVTVFGTLTMREWEKDGVKHVSPEIRIDEIELQGGKQSGDAPRQQSSAPRQNSKPAPNFSDMDDSAPF
jgi:single-strand DNA-binding protein